MGNQASQWEFFRQITRILFKWLNRRSQRTSYTWAGLADLLKRYAVPQPCITEANSSEEPGAEILHAGIREGAVSYLTVLP